MKTLIFFLQSKVIFEENLKKEGGEGGTACSTHFFLQNSEMKHVIKQLLLFVLKLKLFDGNSSVSLQRKKKKRKEVRTIIVVDFAFFSINCFFLHFKILCSGEASLTIPIT